MVRRAQEAVKGGTAWVDKRLRVRKRLQLLAENVRRDLPKVRTRACTPACMRTDDEWQMAKWHRTIS